MTSTNSNVPFAVVTGEGAELGSGMSKREALEAAQRWANEREEAVEVCQGSRTVKVVEPE